jgi:hypothetical protein
MTRGIPRSRYEALAIPFGLCLMALAPSSAAAQGAGHRPGTQQLRPPAEPARRGFITAPAGAVYGLGLVLAAASAYALLRIARDRGSR